MEGLSAHGQAHPPQPSTTRPSASRARIKRLLRWYAVFVRALHRTLLSVLDHDCLNIAQSTAYSAIVALFPALIVAAAVIGLLPDTAPVRFQLTDFFDRMRPSGVSSLLDVSFQTAPIRAHSVRALVSAGVVSIAGASNVIATLMEGLRRANSLSHRSWSFWQRRIRSFELVCLSLVPLALASLIVVFGHAVTGWLVSSIGPQIRTPIYAIALLLRWTLAVSASVGLIALLYRLGVPDQRDATPSPGPLNAPPASAAPSWRTSLPGAVFATALWFPATLFFGWYVTRFTNYSEVYGPLGAGIALLFWLYIISLSVLCGGEFNIHFNAQIDSHFSGIG